MHTQHARTNLHHGEGELVVRVKLEHSHDVVFGALSLLAPSSHRIHLLLHALVGQLVEGVALRDGGPGFRST